MATRIRGSEAINGANPTGGGLSGATTGVKLTYVCPAGKQAVVRLVNVFLTNLAPTIAIQTTINSVTLNLASASTNQTYLGPINLNAGDNVQINVTTLVAASTFDALICADEYPAS